ncbi:MAG: HipA domain-containing protein [Hyphomicrobiales bacterium]|nr:HipA domain-containing protein [Hyphomicrobiales bacterium]
MADVSVLEVQLYGETIGNLTHVQGERTLFSFTDAYIADERRPTLSLSFKDEFGELVTDVRPTRRQVPPFFSNLLPEGHLREYLAERAGVNPEREFFLLWILGRDLPGALTIRPADGEAWPPEPEEETEEEKAARRGNILRFSLAGIQLKFSALKDGRKNKGLTIPAEGVGGSWIVKLPSARFEGVPENEFAMMHLASLIGIDVPDIDLIDLESIDGLPGELAALKGSAFAISRFDRSSDGPVHIEDFAQIFGVFPEGKYGKASYRNVATVLGIETGEDGISDFVRQLVFSVLIGNGDLHIKNFSLIYRDRRTPALSPAYDLVSTIPYIKDDNAALKFVRTKRFDKFTFDELSYLAGKAGLAEKPVLDVAKDTITRFLDVWNVEKTHLPQAAEVTQAIDDHLKTLTIMKG